jgi:hypothetical protein
LQPQIHKPLKKSVLSLMQRNCRALFFIDRSIVGIRNPAGLLPAATRRLCPSAALREGV